jgi:hypothetical protein
METRDLIAIVKNKTLPRITRLNALNEILRCPAPGALKQLLGDDKVLISLTLAIHKDGAASPYFALIYQAFDLNEV